MMTAEQRKAFAALIRPKVDGHSDKFSWRLYKRVLKKGCEQVFVSAWDSTYGRPFETSFQLLKAGDKAQKLKLMIGNRHDGDIYFAGACLRTVCSTGKSTMDFSYGPAFQVDQWLDVTDWFWKEYLIKGRCIVHVDVHQWMKINKNARKCAGCGIHQRRAVITEKVITRKERWI